MKFKSVSEIRRIVELADVSKEERKDISNFKIDLGEPYNQVIGVEAASPKEAREKIIKSLSEQFNLENSDGKTKEAK